jgi:hypothetical protein
MSKVAFVAMSKKVDVSFMKLAYTNEEWSANVLASPMGTLVSAHSPVRVRVRVRVAYTKEEWSANVLQLLP